MVITDALIDLVTYVIAPVINHLFPPLDISAFTSFSSGAASTLGGWLGIVSPYVPITFMLTMLQVVLVMLPAIGGYVIFQWFWNHVPSIAGFGTH